MKIFNDIINNIAVINIAHTNKGNLCQYIPEALILTIVVIIFIDPNIELIPAICKLIITKSTAPDVCPILLDKGGYNVQPVPAPFSIKEEINNIIKEGGNNQNEILFNLGNAISGAPIITGTK